MLKIEIKVTDVDMNGFNGRPNHPEPSDIGCVGVVLGIALQEEGTDIEPDLSEDYPGQHISGPDYDTRDGEGRTLTLQLVTVLLSNGRTVELLGHEFELVAASHNNDIDFSVVS